MRGGFRAGRRWPRRRGPRAALLVASALLAASLHAGCTFEAGSGFGTLEEAGLAARFAPGGRLGEDGSFLTLGGYRVTPDAMSLEVLEVRLDELVTTGGGGGQVFDPANPPPGYSLCHGGHCHHESGALVSYEDIQASLSAGGSSEYQNVVTMAVDDDLDLLLAPPVGDERELVEFDPGTELDAGTISRTQVVVGSFRLTGTVTGGDVGDEVVPLSLSVPADGAMSTLAPTREVGPDADHRITVSVEVPVEATFFDDVALADLVVDGAIDIQAGPAADAVAVAILASSIAVVFDAALTTE